jgi:dihydroflavonol-4-reductase
MRVLVTGANGLLGHHLVRQLVDAGDSVRALVRKTSNVMGLEGVDCERVYGDVRNSDAFREAADGCELIYHTAAVFQYVGYSKEDMYSTAEAGARNAVDAAKDAGVKRIVLTSSTAVLGGNLEPSPLSENAVANLEDMPDYLKTKAIQEQTALEHGKQTGIDVIAVNPSMFIGPQDFRPSASLDLITGYIQDPLKSCFKGGLSIAHVDDIAAGHRLLADKGTPGERHIVSAQNWDYRTIMKNIAELCGIRGPGPDVPKPVAFLAAAGMELASTITRKPPLVTRDMTRALGRFFWYDCSKATKLGFEARPSRDTLADTIAWLIKASFHISDKHKRRLKPHEDVQSLMQQY